jgi:hypothetical protein
MRGVGINAQLDQAREFEAKLAEEYRQVRLLRATIAGKASMRVLTVYFGTPNMFITLWFGFDYGTNPPLGTLII